MSGWYHGPDDPKRKPENPAGEGGLKLSHMLWVILGVMAMWWMFSEIGRNQSEPSSSAPAVQQPPEPRKPPEIFDDGVGTLLVFPSKTWARAENHLKEMTRALAEWKKANPAAVITATSQVKGDPEDYGYHWILHYTKR